MSQGHSNEAVEDDSENVHTFVVNIDTPDANEAGNDLGRPSLLKSASSPGKAAYSTRRPSLRRAQSIKDKFSVGTAKFFGLPTATDQDDENPRVEASTVKTPDQQKWLQRRFRHLKKQYGVKPEAVAEELEPSTDIGIEALGIVEFAPPSSDSPAQSNGFAATSKTGKPRSSDGRLMRAVAGKGLLERRESVMKMAYETFNSVLQGNAFRKSRQKVAEGNRSETLADKSRSSSVRRPNLIANSSFPANPLRMAVPSAVESGLVTMKATARAASHGRFTEYARRPEQQPADFNDAPTTRAPARPKLSRMKGLAFDDTIAQEPLRAESPPARPTSLALQAETEPSRSASKVRFEETSFGGEALAKKPLTAQYTSVADDEVFFDMTPSEVHMSGT
ncbi:hypothetical protein AAVH_01723 [Aphelenchoides avenae]|nr:hypothetical protein AAVH_01723 [Aphelenchus avenae]